MDAAAGVDGVLDPRGGAVLGRQVDRCDGCHGPAGSRHELDRLRGTLLIEIASDDARALGRELQRGRAPHAARGPADQRDLPREISGAHVVRPAKNDS
jgi:hypothetical protein